jgi:hypothetical protein
MRTRKIPTPQIRIAHSRLFSIAVSVLPVRAAPTTFVDKDIV